MRCPICRRAGAYYRLKNHDLVCIQCGKITKVKENKKEKADGEKEIHV